MNTKNRVHKGSAEKAVRDGECSVEPLGVAYRFHNFVNRCCGSIFVYISDEKPRSMIIL
jgi:mannose-6-phosphate isomerase-like protein (cupin superfamily)